MGLSDFFSDIYSGLTWSEVHAEAPAEDDEDNKEESSEEGDKGENSNDDEESEGDEKDDGGNDEEEDEDEEEEDEPEDPKPKLEEECANSAQCAPAKHHFDECVERVTSAHENPDHKGPHEDCVEEFFHLQHCATNCAAPKLFRQLK